MSNVKNLIHHRFLIDGKTAPCARKTGGTRFGNVMENSSGPIPASASRCGKIESVVP